jgi:hypothetical protein
MNSGSPLAERRDDAIKRFERNPISGKSSAHIRHDGRPSNWMHQQHALDGSGRLR